MGYPARKKMDLEQFRKAYMQMEGIANTPVNLFKRSGRFVESITNVPGAIKRDADESRMNAKMRNDILNDIRQNGDKNFDAETLADLIHSGKNPGHTGQAIEQVGGAAASLARSVNELGQTRVPIAGKHSEMYDGPDLEKGISFAITAERIARRPLRLSEKALTNAVNIGMMTRAATRAFKDHDIAEKAKNITRTQNKGIETPDIGGNER